MNSSPPMRTTTSSSRTVDRMRVATVLSSLSPVSWPRESLMCLKRSRSRNSTASVAPVRARFFDSLRQMHGEKEAVRQAGELVVMREVIQVLLLLQQLRFDLPAAGRRRSW